MQLSWIKLTLLFLQWASYSVIIIIIIIAFHSAGLVHAPSSGYDYQRWRAAIPVLALSEHQNDILIELNLVMVEKSADLSSMHP